MAWPSGSGNRTRIELAKSAAGLFLDILGARNSYRSSSDQKHQAAVVSFGSDVIDEVRDPERLRLYEAPRPVTGAVDFQPVLRDIARAVGQAGPGLGRGCRRAAAQWV